MKKTDVAQQQIVEIQTLLEIVKDSVLEDRNSDVLKLLHRASREIKVTAEDDLTFNVKSIWK